VGHGPGGCSSPQADLDHTKRGRRSVPIDESQFDNEDEQLSASLRGSHGANQSRRLKLQDQHRLDRIRGRQISTDWFQRHWLGLIVLAQLGLTSLFVVFATMYGFSGSTIFFGVIAGYNLVALLARLILADGWRRGNRSGVGPHTRRWGDFKHPRM
jgi:hypothetical protein